MNKSLGKNAVLNVIKTAMSVIFPLITFPYVSNVLGVEELGKYNFSNSINSYFLMIAALGISSYAVREGAAIRDDRNKFSKFATEILELNLLSMLIAYILYGVCIVAIPKLQNYLIYLLIFSVEIFFSTVGVEWIYIIFEEYTYITIRRIAFQVISMILLFTLVKTRGDLLRYCAITVCADAGANLLNIANVRKYADIEFSVTVNLRRHISPVMIIFASTLAIKVYTSSDTVMLGFVSGDYAVGLYSVAAKVYNVLKPLISAVTVVSIPRLAAYAGTGSMKEYQKLLRDIYLILFVVALPAIVGLFMLSDNVIVFISNTDYLGATWALRFLSLAVIFSVFSSFYNQCVLIPMKMEKDFLVATIVSAGANIILNFLLIPLYSHNGAALATMISELISLICCYWASKKVVCLGGVFHAMRTSAVSCIGIILACIITKSVLKSNVLCIICSIFVSVLIYAVSILIQKNEVALFMIDKLKKG